MKEITRGDNEPYTLEFTRNGEPEPITGWKIYFTMKKKLSQSDADANLKVDITEHDDPENGKTSIYLTNGQTDDLEPGDYFFDIQVKKADGIIKTILIGKVKVVADVTRRED